MLSEIVNLTMNSLCPPQFYIIFSALVVIVSMLDRVKIGTVLRQTIVGIFVIASLIIISFPIISIGIINDNNPPSYNEKITRTILVLHITIIIFITIIINIYSGLVAKNKIK